MKDRSKPVLKLSNLQRTVDRTADTAGISAVTVALKFADYFSNL